MKVWSGAILCCFLSWQTVSVSLWVSKWTATGSDMKHSRAYGAVYATPLEFTCAEKTHLLGAATQQRLKHSSAWRKSEPRRAFGWVCLRSESCCFWMHHVKVSKNMVTQERVYRATCKVAIKGTTVPLVLKKGDFHVKMCSSRCGCEWTASKKLQFLLTGWGHTH